MFQSGINRLLIQKIHTQVVPLINPFYINTIMLLDSVYAQDPNRAIYRCVKNIC